MALGSRMDTTPVSLSQRMSLPTPWRSLISILGVQYLSTKSPTLSQVSFFSSISALLIGKGNLTIITEERQSPTQSTPSHIEPEAKRMPFLDFLKSVIAFLLLRVMQMVSYSVSLSFRSSCTRLSVLYEVKRIAV